MLERLNRRLFADPKAAVALIRRLLTEHGRAHWRRYCLSLAFMAVGAACTALPALLFGRGIDQAYVYRSFDGVAVVAVAMIVIFDLKGIASYGQAVTMARIANHIIAENQKRMFDKLLQQNVAFYADRHSSEFAARITFGAGAAAQVLNLLINALGRDLLSLIGLVAVMIYQAPLMSMIGIVVMPPAVFGVRKLIKRVRSIVLTQYGGGAEILEAMQETIQGFRIIKAFNLEAVMRARVYASVERVEAASNKLARVSNRATPLMEALGGIAIGVVFLYAGYRVLVLNAAPGEFVSFITRSCSPMSRPSASRGSTSICTTISRGCRCCSTFSIFPTALRTGRSPPSRSRAVPSNSPMWRFPIAPATRCCATCPSSPSLAR